MDAPAPQVFAVMRCKSARAESLSSSSLASCRLYPHVPYPFHNLVGLIPQPPRAPPRIRFRFLSSAPHRKPARSLAVHTHPYPFQLPGEEEEKGRESGTGNGDGGESVGVPLPSPSPSVPENLRSSILQYFPPLPFRSLPFRLSPPAGGLAPPPPTPFLPVTGIQCDP